MRNTHVRFKDKCFNRIKDYQESYALKYHKRISITKIINALIERHIPSVRLSHSRLVDLKLRYNDTSYKSMLLAFISLENSLNRVRNMLINDSNNLNQLAHKVNKAQTDSERMQAFKQIKEPDLESFEVLCITVFKQFQQIDKGVNNIWQKRM